MKTHITQTLENCTGRWSSSVKDFWRTRRLLHFHSQLCQFTKKWIGHRHTPSRSKGAPEWMTWTDRKISKSRGRHLWKQSQHHHRGKQPKKNKGKKYQQIQRTIAYLLKGDISAAVTVRSIINLKGSIEDKKGKKQLTKY